MKPIFFLLIIILVSCREPEFKYTIENKTDYIVQIRGYDTKRNDGDTIVIDPNGMFSVSRVSGEASDQRTFFNQLLKGPDSVRVEFNNSKYLLLECDYEDFMECSFEKCDTCISNLVYGSPRRAVIITEDHYNSAKPL